MRAINVVVLVRRNLWDGSLVSTNGRCPLVEVRLYSCLPTPLKLQSSFVNLHNFLGLTGNSSPFCGQTMDTFWNCTM